VIFGGETEKTHLPAAQSVSAWVTAAGRSRLRSALWRQLGEPGQIAAIADDE
jgi:hypothetical protein